ncbi:fused (3R)-hydroxyacyl-ACP dehydratase subunits HadA/HadB [Nocardia sp. NPDC060256]|uniref:fused (3R)-hydroxyacyl-ACP dehydratase subunits HadA/HadB n=1 Tax=unclassified Nocardia TaxID=2637762 RepID=UPI003669C984
MDIDTPHTLETEPVARIRAIVGRQYRVDDYYEVGREKIREYARAVQDHHPVHRDVATAVDFGYPDLVAPPAFICLLGGTVQKILTDVLDGYNLTTAIQTDQTIDFTRPVVAGDRLTSNLSLQSFRQAFGGDLMVVRNTVTDQHGARVLVADTGLVARSAPTERDHAVAGALTALVRGDVVSAAGPMSTYTPIGEMPWVGTEPHRSLRALPLAAAQVGTELPPRYVDVSLGDLVNYAGVSGDPNPIHWHADAARMVGLEHGVIAHGMLSMAFGAAFVTAWLGDPGAIRNYSVRMTSPVRLVDNTTARIEFRGRIKSVDTESRTAVVALTASQGGAKIFGRATATVQLS